MSERVSKSTDREGLVTSYATMNYAKTARAALPLKLPVGDNRQTTCSDCGRTVLIANVAGTGFLAECGRRLATITECRPEGCAREMDVFISADPGWSLDQTE